MPAPSTGDHGCPLSPYHQAWEHLGAQGEPQPAQTSFFVLPQPSSCGQLPIKPPPAAQVTVVWGQVKQFLCTHCSGSLLASSPAMCCYSNGEGVRSSID